MTEQNNPNFEFFASFSRFDFQRNEILSATSIFVGNKVQF